VTTLANSKATGLDFWITSDGNVYVSQLQEAEPSSALQTEFGTYDGEHEQVGQCHNVLSSLTLTLYV
jgi:hypothetical protein